jgi:hypothetical protein
MGCYAAVDAAARSLNWRNSAAGIVNSVTPQSKQTAIFGNTITVGSSRFLRPEKWMMISEPNSVWLFDEHDLQDITHNPIPARSVLIVSGAKGEQYEFVWFRRKI